MRCTAGLALLALVACCSPSPASPDARTTGEADLAPTPPDPAPPQPQPTAQSADAPPSGNETDNEPNDDRESAQPLAPIGSVKGWISTREDRSIGDQDWFVVEVPGDKASVLSVNLEGPPDLDVVLEWMPLKPSSKRDRAIIQADVERKKPGNEALSNLRVEPGQVYLRVRAAWYRNKARRGSDAPYTLKTDLLPWAQSIEAEPNHAEKDAVLGTFERPARGTLGYIGDRDTWRFPIPRDVGPRIQLSQTGLEGLKQEVSLRWEGAKGSSIQARGDKGEGIALRNIRVPESPSPHLLVTLKTLEGAAPNQAYDLLVTPEVPSEGSHELEPNEGAKRATALVIDRKASGYLDRRKDQDYFAFDVRAPMSGEVRFTPPLRTKGRLKLIAPDGKRTYESAGGAPGAEVFAFGQGLTPGRWLVALSGAPSDSRQPYTLIVTGTESEAQEREPNAQRDDAGVRPLIAERPAKGWIYPAGDVDLWSLKRDETLGPGIVTFQLNPPQGSRVDIHIESMEGEVLTGREGLAAGQPGTFTHFLQPGDYRVKVKGSRSQSYATEPYTLRLLD